MANGRTQVELELIALTQKANAEVRKFSEQTEKQLSSISMATTFSAIADGFNLAKNAFDSVSGFFNKAVGEALEAEESVRLLNNQMRLSGEFSDFASARAQEYAEELAQVTLHSDNQIISALALAKNYGLVNSESRKLVAAAADLAAVTGDDLNSATRKLAETYNGALSKELKKMFPELENLTEAQRRQGAVIDILSKKLSGSAADAVRTYGGELAQARKEVDKFFESIGNVALRVTAFLIRDFKALIRNTGEWLEMIKRDSTIGPTIFETTSQAIKKARQAQLEDLKEREAERKAIDRRRREDAAQAAKEELEDFRRNFASKRKEIELASLSDVARVNKQFQDDEATVRKAFSLGLIKSKQEEITLISGLEEQRGKKIRDIEERMRKERLEVARIGLTDIEKINFEFAEKERQLNEAMKLGYIANEKEKAERMAVIEQERLKRIEAANKETLDRLTISNAKFANDTANAVAEAYRNGTEISKDQAIAAGAGIVANVLKGAEGARQALGAIAGAVANYFIPGIGPVVNQIVQELSKGPEHVVKMVREFREAIPGMVENILTSIPALIESIIEDTPRIVEKIIQMIPRVIDAFIKAIPRIIVAFIRHIPQMMRTMVTEFIKMIPEIIKSFGQGLLDAAKMFVEELINQIKSFGGLFDSGGNGVFGGGGGNGGLLSGSGIPIIEDIGGWLGLAEGGRVPNIAAFKGDKFPARLDAGEQVFSSDLSSRLEKFLDSQGGGGQPMVAQLVFNERVLAEAMFLVNKKGYRTAPV